MIRISIGSDRHGAVWRLETLGHAALTTASGSVPCAAVSALVRTFAHVCEGTRGMEIEGSADKPGKMTFRVRSVKVGVRQAHRSYSRFLLGGLSEIALEYPKEIVLTVRVTD